MNTPGNRTIEERHAAIDAVFSEKCPPLSPAAEAAYERTCEAMRAVGATETTARKAADESAERVLASEPKSDTPETDDLFGRDQSAGAELCRKMERERNAFKKEFHRGFVQGINAERDNWLRVSAVVSEALAK